VEDDWMNVRLRDVRLIDGRSPTARPGLDVVVMDGQVDRIEPTGASSARPAEETVIDGRGRTLLPGLIDCHAHYTIDPLAIDGFVEFAAEPHERSILRAAGMARLALLSGVTTARSAGAPGALDLILRDAIADGFVAGPRLLAAGLAITITGGHGRLFGREADGEIELVRAVRANVRDGSDVIKIVSSEAAMLSTAVAGVEELTGPEIAAIVREARRLHRRVLSHAQNSAAVIASAQGGVASVEHAFLADEAALEVVLESGAVLVPTLVVTDVWKNMTGLTDAQRRRQSEIEIAHRRSCETAIRLGIPIATGTDCGVRGVMPDMVWREALLVNQHGASPMAAIQSATSVASRLLGLESEIGTIEPGKLADLLLVDGDPLADLHALERPSLVMQRGIVVAGS
jgi:imidazolonepropionase-like amidohydrolase